MAGRALGAPPQARGEEGAPPGAARYRTLDDRFVVRHPASLEAWRGRAAYLREHILASGGLLPLPERTPLDPQIFDERKHEDYTVSKGYFESRPGFFVTANLYKPIGPGPFPAVLPPHGHWAYGRLENSEPASGPARPTTRPPRGSASRT